jgi:hypothetical protein
MRTSTNQSASAASIYDNENESEQVDACMKPNLLLRRTNLDYESMRRYEKLHFLNSSTILGVDSYAEFDIVGIPTDGRKVEVDNKQGCGKILVNRIKFSAPEKSNHPLHEPPEVYGYQNGSKFVAGLRSGDMEIFSTERLPASSIRSSTTWLPPTNALWSCLPLVTTQHIGPRRRYARHEMYSLSQMLHITDHEEFFEQMSHSAIELSCWDGGSETFRFDRGQPAWGYFRQHWAFREGGAGSSSALVAAFVDLEMDCFSLRVVDERNNENKQRPTIFSDTSSTGGCRNEYMKSICFSGDFGLVVAYQYDGPYENDSTLKWYDIRKLCDQPTQSMNIVSFPRNKIAGISPIEELTIGKTTSLSHSRLGKSDHLENGFNIEHLVGSNDSSNRFAALLELSPGSCQYVIIDSSRREIVQQFDHNTQQICFSRCLDTAAKFDDGGGLLSIYDISKQRDHKNIIFQQSNKRQFPDVCNEKSHECLVRSKTEFPDVYGIPSRMQCMAMDDCGSSIAFGTDDGDIFIL